MIIGMTTSDLGNPGGMLSELNGGPTATDIIQEIPRDERQTSTTAASA